MNPIILALDVPTLGEANDLARRVGDAAGAVKVGYELFYAHGPAAVIAFAGRHVFLDLKVHDIPTTVARGIKSLQPLDIALLTVHTLGGRAMLEAAAEAKGAIKILGVTILTHLDDAALRDTGLPPAAEAVPHLAMLALKSGCDGVICAPADVAAVRAICPEPFLIVTPGVRPALSPRDDQARVLTPRQASDAGADRLVIGRPITRASDPRAAALAILETLR